MTVNAITSAARPELSKAKHGVQKNKDRIIERLLGPCSTFRQYFLEKHIREREADRCLYVFLEKHARSVCTWKRTKLVG